MAITTYAELQAAAAGWLIRTDLTARILEFIALGEARLNRLVRIRDGEPTASLVATPGSRFISLPAAFTEPKNLWWVESGEEIALNYREPGLMEPTSVQARPDFWGIDGPSLAFECPCDQVYTFKLRYMGGFALSDASPTNSLLETAPDVYLFATLAEAGPLLRDANLSSAYEAKLGRAIKELNTKEGRSKSKQALVTEVAQLVGRQNRTYDITRGY